MVDSAPYAGMPAPAPPGRPVRGWGPLILYRDLTRSGGRGQVEMDLARELEAIRCGGR